MALAMIDLQPHRLLSGEVLSVAALFESTAGGQAAPFPSLLHSSQLQKGLRESAANRLAHPSTAGLRTHLLKISNQSVLVSHGIERPALDALHEGDLTKFVNERGRFLTAPAAQFFSKRARWDETDRPALSALLMPEETD